MQMLYARSGEAETIGILAGSFNPPTLAHVALAEAALTIVDEVLFAVPKELPHKDFSGATLEERAAMLRDVAAHHERFAAGVAEGGLFYEIARETREHYPEAKVYLICGRDAAERILGWDYGDPAFVDRMLQEFHLLVAPRNGVYVPKRQWKHAVHSLPIGDFDAYSSTRVRQAVTEGGGWEELVPASIRDQVANIYLR